MPTLRQRFHADHPSPAARLVLGAGTLADYAALSSHHYRGGRPATATRVLVLRDPTPSAAERWRGTPGQRAVGETVGVLVESLPALSCSLRDHATDGRYAASGGLTPSQRARLLNAEVRCISRVVLDPRWRGLGLAVRLVRAALDSATTRFTESLAAMGRVHPFFVYAGMTAYHRPPHPGDERLRAAMLAVGLEASLLTRLDVCRRRLDDLPDPQRRLVERELLRWARGHGGRGGRGGRGRAQSQAAGAAGDRVGEALAGAQRRLALEPVYFLHVGGMGSC